MDISKLKYIIEYVYYECIEYILLWTTVKATTL